MSLNLADRPRCVFQPGRGPGAAVGQHARRSSRSRRGTATRPRCRCRSSCGIRRRRSPSSTWATRSSSVGRVRRRFFRAGGGHRVAGRDRGRGRARAPAGAACRRCCAARSRRSTSCWSDAPRVPISPVAGDNFALGACTAPRGSARRVRDLPVRALRAPNIRSGRALKESEVNGDRRGEPDSSGGDARPGRDPVRRRLGRRHAARRRPLHRALRRVRQRPRDPAQLPGRDPRPGRHDRRRVVVPGAHLRPRHRDAGRHAERARRDEPGRAQGEPARHDAGLDVARQRRHVRHAQPRQGRLRGEPAARRLARRRSASTRCR